MSIADMVGVWGGIVSTVLAYFKVREYLHAERPILELSHRRVLGGGAYQFSLVVKNPSRHALTIDKVRVRSHPNGQFGYLDPDLASRPMSAETLAGLTERTPPADVEAGSEKMFPVLVTVPGTPPLPVQIELELDLRLRSRTRKPKRLTDHLIAVATEERS